MKKGINMSTMKRENIRNIISIIAFLNIIMVFLSSCFNSEEGLQEKVSKKLPSIVEDTSIVIEDSTSNKDTLNNEEIAVATPPFSKGIFPCSKCHEKITPNSLSRTLVMHKEIQKKFSHDSENRWCLDCHYEKDRDYLKLASGKLIEFKESYKLCGQCHGDKYRDWKKGVHGKRTGFWNGSKKYYLCVNCHNPHAPKFESIEPMPAPVRQEDI